MKIMIEMDSAGPEGTPEETATALAARFGVQVILSGRTSPAGYGLQIIGTPWQITTMLHSDNGGWGSGDDEQDAEQVYYCMRDAVEVFG